ncbi:MAG: transglutaminase domain-containing protein [Candidatus Latescibacteria bacterium]|nr:transglutaminase domain-containing protein [Candidatus Latescibacterota bacterium]
MAPKPAETVALNYKTNYWDLYPRREDISLVSLKPLAEGVGVRLKLRSDMRGFSHFLYSLNDSPFERAVGDAVDIRYEDKGTGKVESARISSKAVADDGRESEAYGININYYPSEHYAAGGQTSNGWIIIQHTDMALTSSRVEDWILQHPTDEEVEFARKTWGHLIQDGRSSYENACAIARSIIDDLDPHRGIPSDAMGKLSPFGQYERVMAGKDRLWCGNIAGIFSYACNSLGIPCRGIGMNRSAPDQPPKGSRYTLLLAEGHGSTEIFSEEHNAWVWIDLTFYILDAHLGDEGPINMAELYHYLNDPNRLKSLRVVTYDPKSKSDANTLVTDSEKQGALHNYFKRDQEFHYRRSVRP